MKETETAKDYAAPMTEMTEKALRNYEQAIRTGLKMQEQAGKWWTSVLNQNQAGEDWRKRWTSMTGMANKLVPMAQRRMEDMVNLVEKNSRTGAELMKKAVEAAQTPAVTESQAKWMEFWSASMGAVRSNTEALSLMSSKAIDSWIEFVRNNTDGAEARGKAA